MIVEVCANSLQSALNAQKGGAHRIELCTELGVGGITPSYGLLKKVKEQVKIPVHVLIRPRSGDFTYSDAEFQTMLEDIALCVSLGFEGIVSGILKSDFEVDWERTEKLIRAGGQLSFTFHRAFDWVKEPEKTLLKLEELGVQTLLTSGQAKTATMGLPLLKKLNKMASRCVVMPGAGIRDTNALIFKEGGFKAIHLSATNAHENSELHTTLGMGSTVQLPDNKILLTDADLVHKVIKCVN
jgi:copper homeostasis protein